MGDIKIQQEQVARYAEWVKNEGGIELPTRLSTLFKPTQRRRLDWLKKNCAGRILEVGTCYGYVLAYCGGHAGLDANENSITLAKILNPQLEFHVGDVRKLPFEDNQFDTVMAPDVLEHLPWSDLKRAIGELRRVAASQVLITFPALTGAEALSFKHQWVATAEKLSAIQRFFDHDVVSLSQDDDFVYLRVLRNTKAKAGINFFAWRPNYIDHLVPIYHAVPRELRGEFTVPKSSLLGYCREKGIIATLVNRGHRFKGVVVTGSTNIGAYLGFGRGYKIALFNHGAGQSFKGSGYDAYAGDPKRAAYDMIIEPGDIPAKADRSVAPSTIIEAIGSPKLDRWHGYVPQRHDPLTIAIGFHQDTRVCPESRSAFEHYKDALPELAAWCRDRRYKLIGAGHPVFWKTLFPLWRKLGIEPVEDWDEVMERADLYIRDQMSTIYEFASLDKPVVVLNAPWYRRNVEHGIRFWEYANVGVQCNEPEELIPCVQIALKDAPEQQALRRRAVAAVYKYRDGKATERAVKLLVGLYDDWKQNPPSIIHQQEAIMQKEPLSYTVIVKNTSQQPVRRGGQVFLPREERQLTCNKYQYSEIRACTFLYVRTMASPSVSIPMEQAKAEREVAEIVKKGTEKPEATNASPEPVEDAPDASQPVLEALPQEVAPPKADAEPSAGKFDCPFCGKPGKSRIGLFSHVRGGHKDVDYEKFKKEFREK